MLKKNILNIVVGLMLLFVIAGCSNSTDSIIEDKNKEIEALEKSVEGSMEMLTKFESKESELTGELEEVKLIADELKAENKELSVALEDSEAKLMALDIDPGGEEIATAISPYPGMSVLVAAINVLDAMRVNDYVTLASYVDPSIGVYVAPYQYIDFSSTYIFSPYEIENLAVIPTLYPWAQHPASGDMITLNLLDYYNEYIYDEDFYFAPVVGMNTVVSSGNMINNIAASFPTSDTVEFLFPEIDPSFGGLDWSSLTLVFNTDTGTPMLLAIVHGQWTP